MPFTIPWTKGGLTTRCDVADAANLDFIFRSLANHLAMNHSHMADELIVEPRYDKCGGSGRYTDHAMGSFGAKK